MAAEPITRDYYAQKRAQAARRLQKYNDRIARVNSRIQWFDQRVQAGLVRSMQKRLDVASQLLHDKIRANISLPIEKGLRGRDARGRFTKAGAARRSRPGEYPRLETARLRNDIFWDHRGLYRRIIGTSLDYGLYLEINMNRSFLRRTLNEHRLTLSRILTRRIN